LAVDAVLAVEDFADHGRPGISDVMITTTYPGRGR
jgi:hypothetical protein